MANWRKIILSVCPGSHRDIVDMVANHADEQFQRHNITNVARQAHLLGNMAVETAGFKALEENLNYTAQRLLKVFPTHFTPESAANAAHNPKMIANIAYGGRMENRPGTDDGWLFRGKGLLQTTGRRNTARLAKQLGISAEVAAAWLIDPDHALEAACATFVMLGAAAKADRGIDPGTIKIVRQSINGGTNGLSEALGFVPRFAKAISSDQSPALGLLSSEEGEAQPESMLAERIKMIQDRLRALNYFGTGQIDGVMGPATRSALFQFQSENDLPANGVPNTETIDALWRASPRMLPQSRENATEEELRVKGSETIARADTIEANATKMAVGAGSLSVLGGLDTISGVTDAVQKFQTTADGVANAKQWIFGHWPSLILLALAAALVYWAVQNHIAAKAVKKIRLKDHRSGANMGR